MRKINKQVVIETIIEKCKQENENAEIQTAFLNGFDRPGRIILKGSENKGYTPDVLVKGPGTLDLFEVELGSSYQPEKWRLFSLYTNTQNGHFNIVTHEDQLPQLRDFLDKNNIKARILYFS